MFGIFTKETLTIWFAIMFIWLIGSYLRLRFKPGLYNNVDHTKCKKIKITLIVIGYLALLTLILWPLISIWLLVKNFSIEWLLEEQFMFVWPLYLGNIFIALIFIVGTFIMERTLKKWKKRRKESIILKKLITTSAIIRTIRRGYIFYLVYVPAQFIILLLTIVVAILKITG